MYLENPFSQAKANILSAFIGRDQCTCEQPDVSSFCVGKSWIHESPSLIAQRMALLQLLERLWLHMLQLLAVELRNSCPVPWRVLGFLAWAVLEPPHSNELQATQPLVPVFDHFEQPLKQNNLN